jgi:phospholipase/carboxylesterase
MILALWWFGCRAAALGLSPPDLAFVEGEAREGPMPLVVAIHGLGARPESLLAMVAECGLPVRVVAPRGPYAHGDGWSWFDTRIDSAGVAFDEDQVRASADAIAALIGRLARERSTVGRPVVTGFSQGGVLSFVVAARHPGVVGLAVPIAGALPDAFAPGAGPTPRIRAVHGGDDELVPAAWARASVDGLRAAGWDAEVKVFEGAAHEVDPPMHAEVCGAIASALPP